MRKCLAGVNGKTCFDSKVLEPEEYCDVCQEDHETNEAEEAWENYLTDFYGGSAPVTLREQQEQARRLK